MAYSRKVTRWHSECGKGYWDKLSAFDHDNNCKCWTNPKNRACRTCKHAERVPYDDDTGDGRYFACNNDRAFDEHRGAPDSVDYISVNCPLWEKSKYKRV